MTSGLKKELPVLVRLAVLEGMEAHEARCLKNNLCPMKEKTEKLEGGINGINLTMAKWSGIAFGASTLIGIAIKLFWR